VNVTRLGASHALAPGPHGRPGPHRFSNNVDAPGTCVICRLIKANSRHDEERIVAAEAAVGEAHAEERRRLGERED